MQEFDVIKHAVEYSEKKADLTGKRISFHMTTNGVLMDREKLLFLRDHNIPYLLSIDGDRESNNLNRRFSDGTGSFDKLMDLMPTMKELQPWLGARMTVDPRIVDKLAHNFKFLIQKRFNQVLMSPVEGVEWSKGQMDEYTRQMVKAIEIFKEYKKKGYKIRMNLLDKIEQDYSNRMKGVWGCRAGRKYIAVAPDGRIFPCSKMLYPETLAQKCCLGHVNSGFTNVQTRMIFNDYIPIERNECEQCEYGDSCTGGCYATNYWETGDMFKPGKQSTCEFGPQGKMLREMYFEKYPRTEEMEGNPMVQPKDIGNRFVE